VTSTGSLTSYSYGWVIGRGPGQPLLSHTGEATGGEGFLAVYPATHTVFAALWDESNAGIMNAIIQGANQLGAAP
jgi:hypothetical protein